MDVVLKAESEYKAASREAGWDDTHPLDKPATDNSTVLRDDEYTVYNHTCLSTLVCQPLSISKSADLNTTNNMDNNSSLE